MWEQLTNFHFLRPLWLVAIIPLAALAWVYAHRRLKAGNWSRVCDDRLLPFILIGQQQAVSPWRLLALVLCGLLLIVALAGPAWNKLPQPVFRSQAALVIALDLSRSMDVTDIKPSRLTRARHKILDILDKRSEGQTALIVYAAEPFVVTPLTEDSKTVKTLVKDLTTDLMPSQGSYPEKALEKAIELFKHASIVNGHVLMVTDGIESPGMSGAVKDLTSAGYRLSILGIGTQEGAPIASRKGGFIKDQKGSIVLSRLDTPKLRAVAREGNGVFVKMSASDNDIDYLLKVVSPSQINDEFTANRDKLNLTADQWREEGPWILLVLLPLIALVFRRGYLVVLVAVLLPVPQGAYAFDWSSLWENKNQQAAAALEQGDSQSAAKMFTDPEWKAAASYRAGDYQKAVESLQGIENPDALYNRGNALAKAGDIQQAIKAYDEALELNPKHEDARYNRDLLQEFLKQQQQQQQDGNQSQNSDDNKNSENSQNSDQQQQSDNQQNSKDQQDSQSAQDQQSQSQQDRQADNAQQQQDQQAQKDQSQKDSEQEEKESRSAQQEENKDDSQDEDKQSQMAKNNDEQETDPETLHLTEQWLRRIPDDPGGLLRRKFRYQSQIDPRRAQGETKPW